MAVAATDTVIKLRSLIYGGKRSSVTRMVSFCHNTGCWSNVGELETWARTIHMSSRARISLPLLGLVVDRVMSFHGRWSYERVYLVCGCLCGHTDFACGCFEASND